MCLACPSSLLRIKLRRPVSQIKTLNLNFVSKIFADHFENIFGRIVREREREDWKDWNAKCSSKSVWTMMGKDVDSIQFAWI